MIEARVSEIGTEKVGDWLGPDGTFREAHYPSVSVEFVDTDTKEVIAGAAYPLRPGSAIETMDDVKALARSQVERLTEGELGAVTEHNPFATDEQSAGVPPEALAEFVGMKL